MPKSNRHDRSHFIDEATEALKVQLTSPRFPQRALSDGERALLHTDPSVSMSMGGLDNTILPPSGQATGSAH